MANDESFKEEDVKKIGKGIAEESNVDYVKMTVMFNSGVSVSYNSLDDREIREIKLKRIERELEKETKIKKKKQ